MPRSSLTKLRYELACIISNPKFGKKGGSWPSGIGGSMLCQVKERKEKKKEEMS